MKVAVVGAGATGLTAAYFLSEYSEHEVHLFDAADRAGGHAHALPIPSLHARASGEKCTDDAMAWVETGFLVFNRPTYPNFCRLLDLLGIGAVPAEISWSFSRGQGEYAWCSRGLRGVFVQPCNVLSARHWRMLWDMLRFNACAGDIIRAGDGAETIGDFLARNKYSAAFRDDYLMPFVSAIWATPPGAAVLDFPIASLVHYMHNHHLMQVTKGPRWLTVAKFADSLRVLWFVLLGVSLFGAAASLSVKEVPMHTYTDDNLGLEVASTEVNVDAAEKGVSTPEKEA